MLNFVIKQQTVFKNFDEVGSKLICGDAVCIGQNVHPDI